MIILTLDPAASTGYVLTEILTDRNGKSTANVYEYGFIDVDASSNYQGDWCLDLMAKLQIIIDTHWVEHIAVEDYFFSKKFANGSNNNAAYRTAIHILARQNDIPYTILNISAWKTYIAGSSRPSKEQKKRWGAEAAKKLYIQEALYTWYGFRFPNHSLSPKTGKPIVFRYDIIDAVAQSIYYCEMICKVKSVTMSVEVPEDVVFKRPPKKLFVYPS